MPNVNLKLDDTSQVDLQLRYRLCNLRQLLLAKILEAWIKAICPKKQAKFPYQNRYYKKIGGTSPKPEWWPPLDVCVYREPDHIDRDQRVSLFLHLLRLRPTPVQLKGYNKDEADAEPNPTYAPRGWTAFLKANAPTQMVEDSRKDSSESVEILEEIYEIAEREESALSCDYGINLGLEITIEDATKSRRKNLIRRHSNPRRMRKKQKSDDRRPRQGEVDKNSDNGNAGPPQEVPFRPLGEPYPYWHFFHNVVPLQSIPEQPFQPQRNTRYDITPFPSCQAIGGPRVQTPNPPLSQQHYPFSNALDPTNQSTSYCLSTAHVHALPQQFYHHHHHHHHNLRKS